MRVYTGGTFDLFHYGHIEFLKVCLEFAGDEQLMIGLNTDEFVAKFKDKPPVQTYYIREQSLYSCFGDKIRVVVNDGLFPHQYDRHCLSGLDLIVIGSDWARKDYYSQMGFDQDWLDRRRIGLCYVPYTDGISSTKIKKDVSEWLQ